MLKGDVLLEINNVDVKNLTHNEVVYILKECPTNAEISIRVQRPDTLKNELIQNYKFNYKEAANLKRKTQFRSKTPTAELFGARTKTKIPTRSKTPLIDTRALEKTSRYDDFSFSENENRHFNFSCYINNENKSKIVNEGRMNLYPSMDEFETQQTTKYFNDDAQQTLVKLDNTSFHSEECCCFICDDIVPCFNIQDPSYKTLTSEIKMGERKRSNGIQHGFDNNPNQLTESLAQEQDYDDIIDITLERQSTGFGFRVVGGIEDGSQIAVGHIIPNGAADLDGRIATGDEILMIDGIEVVSILLI